jgi:hypothetical protein
MTDSYLNQRNDLALGEADRGEASGGSRGNPGETDMLALRLLQTLRIASPDSTSLPEGKMDWEKVESILRFSFETGLLPEYLTEEARNADPEVRTVPGIVDGIRTALLDSLAWQTRG